MDKSLTYNKLVGAILEKNPKVIFVYAGDGDDGNLKKLEDKYNGRVYHIKERKDLYQVMKHIKLYLNTYPIIGGLMTQYAVAAGKIPITLVFGAGEEVLIDQKSREIEYATIGDIVDDVSRLLNDPNYLKKREEKLIGSLTNEIDFTKQLSNLLNNNNTDYRFHIEMPKTDCFKNLYRENFNIEKFRLKIARKNNLPMFYQLWKYYAKKAIGRFW